jgi:hypothetical protein
MLKHIIKLHFSLQDLQKEFSFLQPIITSMNSPRPSVTANISLKASLFITQAQIQRTAVYCVFSVLHVIR